MKLRDWVTQRFGGTGNDLLDRTAISDEELKKDKYKLEHELKRLESEMNEHEVTYNQLLQKGASASEQKRQMLAQKAELEKKKYAAKKKQFKSNRLKLGTVISIQGMREIMDLDDDSSLNIDQALDDADVARVRENVVNQMAQFNMEMEEMEAIQDALDIEIMDDDSIGEQESDALQKMNAIRAAEMDVDDVDIEASAQQEVDEVDVSVDLDAEVDLEQEGVDEDIQY